MRTVSIIECTMFNCNIGNIIEFLIKEGYVAEHDYFGFTFCTNATQEQLEKLPNYFIFIKRYQEEKAEWLEKQKEEGDNWAYDGVSDTIFGYGD